MGGGLQVMKLGMEGLMWRHGGVFGAGRLWRWESRPEVLSIVELKLKTSHVQTYPFQRMNVYTKQSFPRFFHI